MNELTKKANNAFKWSSITEVVAKLIAPFTNMVLARLLTPSDFGVLATVLMVISFAEIFVEAGLQKYIIQHEFLDEAEEKRDMSVAFWFNIIVSMTIWFIIFLFQHQIARLVVNEGLSTAIVVTGSVIPVYGIIGIQTCKLKKDLDFKSLFYVRLITSVVPLIITIPLALLGLNYWSLIIGSIAGIYIQCASLAIIGKFKPLYFYNKLILVEMLSFGIWAILDGLALWGTSWIDSLIVSRSLDEYYLGLYRNSISTLNSIISIVTASIIPVLFSSLSKLQNNETEFKNHFLSVQKTLSAFLIPLGVGIYCYRDLVTLILFGGQWVEAGTIIGITALTLSLRTVFTSIYSSAFQAKGKFYISFLLQLLDICILVPSCIIASKIGFWNLVYTRAFVRLDLVVPEMIAIWIICRIKPIDTARTVLHPVVASLVMYLFAMGTQGLWSGLPLKFFSIILCMLVYFSVLFAFQDERNKYFYPAMHKTKRILRNVSSIFSR